MDFVLFFVLILDKFFDCEYCSLEFPSRHDRIQHTATHFKSKSCTTCHKLLLCINGDWYELHALPGCSMSNDSTNDCHVEITNQIKREPIDVVCDSLKFEINDNDSPDGFDEAPFDSSPIHEPQIEVNTLPPLVQSLAKLKKNITISRAKSEKRPNSEIENISEWNVQRIVRPVRAPVQKKAKKASNKAKVFMDHRPLGNCICDICGKTLANFWSLRSHIYHQHCPSGRTERVSCSECGQTFSSPGNLKLHSRIHLKCKV